MPWSNQGGSGNGGGWKPGGGSGGPWGQGPSGGGSSNQPDLEDILKKGQDRWKQMSGRGRGGGGWGFGFLVAAVIGIGALLWSCIVVIQEGERGVKLHFGKYTENVLAPGLHFKLPYPIDRVIPVDVQTIRETQVGYRDDQSANRYGGRSDSFSEESLMLTGDENIVNIDFAVNWDIESASKYLFNISNPEQTVKEVAESTMREIIGQRNLQPILTQDRSAIQTEVEQHMQTTLSSYNSGISVKRVVLKKVDPPKEVIDAFRDVQAAVADQERIQEEANRYRNKVVEEAKGQASRIVQAAEAYKEKNIAEAKGKADRFDQILAEYTKAPEVTRRRMFLETMERVFGGVDKIIIDNTGSGTGSGGGVIPYLPLNELTKPRTPARGE